MGVKNKSRDCILQQTKNLDLKRGNTAVNALPCDRSMGRVKTTWWEGAELPVPPRGMVRDCTPAHGM